MSEKTVSPAERGADMKGLEEVPPRSVWGGLMNTIPSFPTKINSRAWEKPKN